MKRALLLIGLIISVLNCRADWSTDMTENSQITPSDIIYYEKDIDVNVNGRTYILLVVPSGQNGNVYRLQILDKDGNRTLGRGGKVISAEKNRTWTTWNQYVQTDNEGNAFIGVQDKRCDDENIVYTIYKYSETGEALWKGTTLDEGNSYPISAGLSMALTDDGGVLCAYCFTDTEKNQDFVHIEKLDKEGISCWKKNAVQTARNSNPYPFVINAGDGKATFLWVANGGIEANTVDTQTGELLYESPKKVYTNGFASSKVMEVLEVKDGPDKGSIISVIDGNKQGRLVYVKKDLSLGLDAKTSGVLLDKTENTNFASTCPAVAYSADDNTFSCLYKSFDYDNIANQAIYFQKIGMDGNEKWENGGKVFVPLQTDVQYSYFKLRSLDNGAAAAFYLTYDNGTHEVDGEMTTFDKDGNVGDTKVFANKGNNKVELWVSEKQDSNKFITAWDEKSSSNYSLFMKCVDAAPTSDIKSISTEFRNSARQTFYSLDGIKHNCMQKGINIVRMDDGKAIKVAE